MRKNKPPRKSFAAIGEFAFIKKIVDASRRDMRMGLPAGIKAVVPNGDDAAVLLIKPSRSRECLAVSADMLVEGVHFDTSLMSYHEIGMKAIVANISDMAAIGGAKPFCCVVCLAIPVDINVENVDKILSGIRLAARNDALSLLGGDTVRSRKGIVISVTILGALAKNSVIERRGASVGDLLCATGTFGDAAAGLSVLSARSGRFGLGIEDERRGNGKPSSGEYGQLVRAYRRPRHRLSEAIAIAASSGRPTAMMDSSDGLAACARAISSSSGLGARVFLEDVPLSRSFMRWTTLYASGLKDPKFPWRAVLEGGEEYELVFTASRSSIAALKKRIDFSIVGEMTRGPDVDFLLHGKKMKGEWRGYENF
ncbi:MAG: thiamine-phosphate kinase [Endomicrobiia bacterium]|nr:thiamine-phosphate kinase [Endomicrobiia bacterium]